MKYYQVQVSAEPKIIGVNNGVYQLEIDYKEVSQNKDFESFFNFFAYKNKDFWKNQEHIKEFRIPAINGRMLKKAKVTDIMGYTPNLSFLDEIYSHKFVSILKEFDNGIYGCFEVHIENVLEKYYLLFNKTICLNEINYQDSVIVSGNSILDNLKYHQLKDEFEYIEFKERNPISNFEKISISKHHFGKDVIDIQALANPFYSEKLIDRLLNEEITGLEIKCESSTQLIFA